MQNKQRLIAADPTVMPALATAVTELHPMTFDLWGINKSFYFDGFLWLSHLKPGD